MNNNKKIKLIDSHCHLNYPQLLSQMNLILENAKNANVALIQTICTKRSDIQDIINIMNNHHNIFGSIGIHPSYITKEEFMKYEEILSFCNSNQKFIGIGETGLDYYNEHNKNNAVQKLQKESFLQHIYASQNSNLGLIIHTRAAKEDTYEILKSEKTKKNFNAVLHCFTESKEFAYKMLDLGFYISFSGICTFKNSLDLQEVIKCVPLSKILIETDSPYLAPQAHRGKTNQPSYVKYVAEKISELKNINIDEVASITSDNFYKVFPKALK